jgi:hypothetical protein
MRKLIATAFVATVGLALVSPVRAMPIAPLDQPEAGNVIQVYGGCGWGAHRGPFGGCRPLYNCPPGWHTGPWGRVCRRNWY